jgi:ABC-2 type transport system ATP-binding protein
MSAVIELDGLSVRFGKLDILKKLTGSLKGQSIGLLGPNGAGKTTLLHTLLGFHPPSEGSARIFGKDILTELKQIRGRIGYMPEMDSFIAGMSAVRMTRLMAELSGIPERLAFERAHEALYFVGLGEARYRPLESYSLGMKQMAKLAQAIVHGPRLIFLDEPTNGLDPPHRQRMVRLIQEIRDSGDVNIVLSSHLLRDVEECCDEVLILKDGEIAVSCNLEEERLANRKFILVETIGSCGDFAGEIEALEWEHARLGENKIKMVLPQGAEIRLLYEIASRRKVKIRRLDYKKDSLQDIFLKAMGSDSGSL